MSLQNIATALKRVETVLTRRPETGLHDDLPAAAAWQGGTRVVTRHANGTALPTDMAVELGGSGEHVTPGWLFRAGLASCAVTSIVFVAAAEGIALTTLEVRAASRSDSRGMLGLADASGEPVHAGPGELTLRVRIAAEGASAERLRALVEEGLRRSPVPNAASHATPYALHIDTSGA
jgi:uncharacterized OsmC-like protein